MTTTNKQYLGDGVYAGVEDGMVRLTTENGLEASNVIWLEPEVVVALLRYLRHTVTPECWRRVTED